MSNQKELDTAKDLINIKLMDQEFKIKCPKNKIFELQQASSYLERKMHEASAGVDKFVTIDRITIVAALNIVHELIAERQEYQTQIVSLKEKILNLKNEINQKLNSNE